MSQTILLVEDDDNDADLALRSLRKARVRASVVRVTDGEEALAYLLDDTKQLPSLVLLDWKLPKVGGEEVLQRMRAEARTKRIAVVVLTSSRETQDIHAAYDRGANSFVCKPLEAAEFEAATREIGAYWLTRNELSP